MSLPNPQARALIEIARDASIAQQYQSNRQIYPVLRVLFRAPNYEKWRLTADLALQTLREPAALHERKAWQTSVLQSSAVGSEHDKMALLALEKAP